MIEIHDITNTIFTSMTYILSMASDKLNLSKYDGTPINFTSNILRVGANTRLPRADKMMAKVYLKRIMKLAKGMVIFSGHHI